MYEAQSSSDCAEHDLFLNGTPTLEQESRRTIRLAWFILIRFFFGFETNFEVRFRDYNLLCSMFARNLSLTVSSRDACFRWDASYPIGIFSLRWTPRPLHPPPKARVRNYWWSLWVSLPSDWHQHIYIILSCPLYTVLRITDQSYPSTRLENAVWSFVLEHTHLLKWSAPENVHGLEIYSLKYRSMRLSMFYFSG